MVEDEPGQVPKLPEDARLDSLEQRLERAEADRSDEDRPGAGGRCQ